MKTLGTMPSRARKGYLFARLPMSPVLQAVISVAVVVGAFLIAEGLHAIASPAVAEVSK